MTVYYADSSALVKRYVMEAGSTSVQAVCDPAAGHVVALAHVGMVEIAAALGVKHRQGHLPAGIRDGLLHDLLRDGHDQYWLIEVDQEMVAQAINLTKRHKLRGYDAVHLACALFVQKTLLQHNLAAPVLLASDQDLLGAAEGEGLLTQDPCAFGS